MRDFLLSLTEEQLSLVNRERETLAYNLANEWLFPLSLASDSILRLRNKTRSGETVMHALSNHPDLVARLPEEFLTTQYFALRSKYATVAYNLLCESKEGEKFVPVPEKLQKMSLFSFYDINGDCIAYNAIMFGAFPPGLWTKSLPILRRFPSTEYFPDEKSSVFHAFFTPSRWREEPYLTRLLKEVKDLGKDSIQDILFPLFEMEPALNKEDKSNMHQQVTGFLCEVVETGDLKTIREVVDVLKGECGKSLLSDANSAPRSRELKNLILGNSARAFNEVFDPELLQSPPGGGGLRDTPPIGGVRDSQRNRLFSMDSHSRS